MAKIRSAPTPPISLARLKKEQTRLSSDPERLNFETLWQNATDYCNPADSDIKRNQVAGSRKVPNRVTDVAIEAARVFMTGMYSFAVGTGNFFHMAVSDKELMKREDVKNWLAECTRRMLYELRGSNFEAEAMQTFHQLSYIGTANTYSEFIDGSLNYRTQHISQYWISLDAKNRVNKVFVESELTAEQINEEYFLEENSSPFPEPDVIKAAMDGQPDKKFKVIQATMRNPKPDPDSIFPEAKPFISTYYLKEDDNAIIYIDGHDTFPFHVARLYKSKNESYGRSCFMECEKSCGLVDDQKKTLIRGGKNRADPAWIEAADSRTRHIRSNEMHKVIYDPTSLGGPPVQADIKSDVGITEAMIEIDTAIVQKAFYNNSFNPLQGLKNMSATEAIERLNMALSETTPIAVKWYREYLIGLLSRSYGLLVQNERMPEAPEVLNGVKLEFEFVSKAALALMQLESYSVIEAYEKIAVVSDRQPEVLDTVNPDKVGEIIMDAANVRSIMSNDDATVKKIRDNRAEMQAAERKLEALPAVADAANKMAGSEKQ